MCKTMRSYGLVFGGYISSEGSEQPRGDPGTTRELRQGCWLRVMSSCAFVLEINRRDMRSCRRYIFGIMKAESKPRQTNEANTSYFVFCKYEPGFNFSFYCICAMTKHCRGDQRFRFPPTVYGYPAWIMNFSRMQVIRASGSVSFTRGPHQLPWQRLQLNKQA